VEWKRNARVAHTKGVTVELQQGSNAATQVIFDDHLEMLGNLHRDPTDANYEKKDYKFSLCDVCQTGDDGSWAHGSGSTLTTDPVWRASLATRGRSGRRRTAKCSAMWLSTWRRTRTSQGRPSERPLTSRSPPLRSSAV